MIEFKIWLEEFEEGLDYHWLVALDQLDDLDRLFVLVHVVGELGELWSVILLAYRVVDTQEALEGRPLEKADEFPRVAAPGPLNVALKGLDHLTRHAVRVGQHWGDHLQASFSSKDAVAAGRRKGLAHDGGHLEELGMRMLCHACEVARGLLCRGHERGWPSPWNPKLC